MHRILAPLGIGNKAYHMDRSSIQINPQSSTKDDLRKTV
jgi:hypothetical protein